MERGGKEGGKKECQKGKDEWRKAGRLEEGSGMERLFFINLYLFRECRPSEHALSLRRPVLYSRLHPFTPGTCPDFFYCLATEQLTRATGG